MTESDNKSAEQNPALINIKGKLMIIKKYALIGVSAISATVTGMHYVSSGWQAAEDYAYKSYKQSKLYRYVSALETEGEIDVNQAVTEAANTYKLPEALIKGVIHIESGNNPSARSSVGAIGMMQIMPFNAKRCNTRVNKLWDEKININCGAKILKEELTTYKDVRKALMSYNGGPRCINKCQESIKYANNVMIKTSEYLVK